MLTDDHLKETNNAMPLHPLIWLHGHLYASERLITDFSDRKKGHLLDT